VTLNVVRDGAPLVTSPTTFTFDEDTRFNGQITAIDPEGAPLTIEVQPGVALGKDVDFRFLDNEGHFAAIPSLNFNGEFRVPILISAGATTLRRVLVLNVTPVIDAPVAVDDTVNLTYALPAPGSASGKLFINASTLIFNDYDPDGLSGNPIKDLSRITF